MSDVVLTATASVATTGAARYAKQLASHLGRKAEVRDEPAGVRLILGGGDCRLVPGDAALELIATAPDEESLDRVMAVIGSHLERFGARNELTVAWVRT